MNQGSYDIHASHRDRDTEVARLRIQAAACWNKEMRNLRGFGLTDGMTLLEVGSGPGYITELLLEALPTSRITALEIDSSLTREASLRLAARGLLGRVDIVNAAVLESGLPDHQFDFAVARLVFQHLPDPVAAAREMLRTLKPGGKLVIIDSDDAIWGLSEPAIPELSAVLQVYGQAQAMQGGNRLVGRFLVRLLQQAGCINPDLEALVSHSDLIGLDALLPHLDPDRLMPLVSCGALPADALDAYRASHRTFTGADSPQLIMLLLMACGQKPGTPTTERIGALGSAALP